MNQFVSAEFRDFDAFVEAIEDVDVDIMTLSSLHRSRWVVQGAYLENGMHVQTANEGGGSIATGVTTGNGCNIFMHRGRLMRVNGQEMHSGSAFILPPRSEFVLSADDGNQWYSINIPESLMYDLGLIEDEDGKEFHRPRVVRRKSAQTHLLRRHTHRFLSVVNTEEEIAASDQAIANYQKELVRLLRECYGRRQKPPTVSRGRPIVTDRLMVGRAIDAIQASTDSKLSMKDLVMETGVSERSLRAGFQRYLGVSPQCFMQLMTLNRAREQLFQARPDETSVTRVAADLGQWDVGRFAARYKQAFGELPSETLKSTGS